MKAWITIMLILMGFHVGAAGEICNSSEFLGKTYSSVDGTLKLSINQDRSWQFTSGSHTTSGKEHFTELDNGSTYLVLTLKTCEKLEENFSGIDGFLLDSDGDLVLEGPMPRTLVKE